MVFTSKDGDLGYVGLLEGNPPTKSEGTTKTWMKG